MFRVALKEHYPGYTQLTCVFQLAEPLIYTFHRGSKSYLLYVLQNRAITTKKGIAHIVEVLVGEIEEADVTALLNSSTPIYDVLQRMTHKQRLGAINDTIYPPKPVADIETIYNRIPRKNVTLRGTQADAGE